MDSAHRFQTFFYMPKPKWFEFVLAVKRPIQPSRWKHPNKKPGVFRVTRKNLRDDQSLRDPVAKTEKVRLSPDLVPFLQEGEICKTCFTLLLKVVDERTGRHTWVVSISDSTAGRLFEPCPAVQQVQRDCNRLWLITPNCPQQTSTNNGLSTENFGRFIGPTDCPTAPHGKSPRAPSSNPIGDEKRQSTGWPRRMKSQENLKQTDLTWPNNPKKTPRKLIWLRLSMIVLIGYD